MASEKAHRLAEEFLGQRLLISRCTETLEGRPNWQRLSERPVTNISGDLAMAIDIDAAGVGWVRTERARTISYEAGMASCEDGLPEPIRRALAEIDSSGREALLCDSARALLRPYRVASLARQEPHPMTQPYAGLLPCPFCGCEAVLGALPDTWGTDSDGRYSVECDKCGAQAPSRGRTKDEARAAWNTRADPSLDRCIALKGALRDARAAIASLDEFALGGVDIPDTHTGESVGQYGIRDELLASIDATLSGERR